MSVPAVVLWHYLRQSEVCLRWCLHILYIYIRILLSALLCKVGANEHKASHLGSPTAVLFWDFERESESTQYGWMDGGCKCILVPPLY
jgi:hypothetical protein